MTLNNKIRYEISQDLQKLLPFGYLFLVILGIARESIFYNQLGINILNYSTIMDILISPISILTSHPLVFIIFILLILSLYFIIYFLSKNYKKNWIKKFLGSKSDLSTLSELEVKTHFGNKFIGLVAIGLVSFFLGIGIGNGKGIAERNESGSLNYTTNLTFNTNEKDEVYLIGSNSANIFYYSKDNKNVKISPVLSIKSIEILNKK